MGTNFYAQQFPTKDQIDSFHKLIDEKNWDALKKALITEEIHLGKRSVGWQFGFDHNCGKFYEPNRKSLEAFTRQSGIEIYDESGKKMTAEEFWEMVDAWNANSKNNWTSKIYNEQVGTRERPQNIYCREDADMCREKWGVVPEGNDFSVEGLRFLVSTDFS